MRIVIFGSTGTPGHNGVLFEKLVDRSNHARSIAFRVAPKILAGVLLIGVPAETAADGDPLQPAASAATQISPAAGCEALQSEAPASTFVLFDALTEGWTGCNLGRVREPFLPASTFKIPHALIALETGVVKEPSATIAWDGRQRAVAAWNQDTSLALGLKNSTVWVYQGTARRIGHRRMREWVRRLDYGNGRIGGETELASFWLDGQLRISAVQQVVFLDRLRRCSLPASKRSQALVAEMMRLDDEEETPDSGVLFAKSGAVLPIDPGTGDLSSDDSVDARLFGQQRVGWYVGWLQRPAELGGDQVFALNLDITEPGDLRKRAALTRKLLHANRTPSAE